MSIKLPTFPLVITKASFQQWSDEMAEKGLLFHYEDDPFDCLGDIFPVRQCREVSEFLDKAFASDFDPMECCLVSYNKSVLCKLLRCTY